MTERYCNVCKIKLDVENSYFYNSNNLCRKHHHKYYNNIQKKTGYTAMKKYSEKNDKTPKRKSQLLETSKRMYAKYPEKWRARAKVTYAIKTGKIIRPRYCESCLTENTKIQAHHEDYSKPLEVKWLCIKCHNKTHHEFVTVDNKN